MVKKIVALSLLAVSFSAHSKIDEQGADLLEKTYREGKAKVTKAFKKENAVHLSKATLYGTLAATGAYFSIENLKRLHQTPKNLFQKKVAEQSRLDAFKLVGIERARTIISILAGLAVSSYATYKAGEETYDHLKKTQE